MITIPLLYRSFQVGGAGGPATASVEPSRARALADYARSTVVGVAFSVGWTPCVGPILAGILVLALDSASLLQAIILLICYAAGLGIPFLIVGATFGASTRFLRKLNRWMPLISVVSGVLLVFVGMLIALDRVLVLNEALGSFGVEILVGSDGSSTDMLDLHAGSAAIAFAAGFVSFISPCVLPARADLSRPPGGNRLRAYTPRSIVLRVNALWASGGEFADRWASGCARLD